LKNTGPIALHVVLANQTPNFRSCRGTLWNAWEIFKC